MTLRGEDFYREHEMELRHRDARHRDRRRPQARRARRGRGATRTARSSSRPARSPVKPPHPGHRRAARLHAANAGRQPRHHRQSRDRRSARSLIGASFIGLEVAASLRARGLEVHVVAPEAVPLARVLGEAMGGLVKRVHEEHGVVFHLGIAAARDRAGRRSCSRAASAWRRTSWSWAPGCVRTVSLAEQAGLAVDRGIVVDAGLRTSAPDIWAIGDAARWPDARTGESIRVEHWVVAERMGQFAARSLLGAKVACDIVPFFWSAHYDVTINYVGHAERWDRIDIAGSLDARDAAVAFRKGARRWRSRRSGATTPRSRRRPRWSAATRPR